MSTLRWLECHAREVMRDTVMSGPGWSHTHVKLVTSHCGCENGNFTSRAPEGSSAHLVGPLLLRVARGALALALLVLLVVLVLFFFLLLFLLFVLLLLFLLFVLLFLLLLLLFPLLFVLLLLLVLLALRLAVLALAAHGCG
ncbi:hypothetical protein JKP88DRAFT_43577 [Tribonema minus]|uniref:Uncharacterized protein n=1 Tax=Tribonema minus TaxID=303371 RepID=A0A836CGP8_9STRA|nr:hypothetical protein JKP88DRAFT_43577 [Tribonema minus]